MGWLTTRPRCPEVEAKLDQIESEMKRIGMWQQQPLAQEQREVKGAFGQGSMSFEQWLQFVFIPNVRALIASRGKFPSSSEVSTQALREWKMWGSMENVDHLLDLLREFDELFGWSARGLFRKLDSFIERIRGGSTCI